MSRFPHAYHPHCGCSFCCQQEEAEERDDEMRASYLSSLSGCADFIGEVALNAEECDAAAAAINAGDMAKLGQVFLSAVEREASTAIETRAESCGITPGEAAKRLIETYREESVRSRPEILKGNTDLVPAEHATLGRAA